MSHEQELPSKLFISFPGKDDYQVYQSDVNGARLFHFVSFDQSDKLTLAMSLTEDESLDFYFNENEERPREMSKTDYLKLISKTIDHIKNEKLGKVVISRAAGFEMELEPVEVFQKLVNKYPSACVYLFSNPGCGTWMGATPEVLLKGQNGTTQTMSLAGTRKRGEEHTFTVKEKVEQELVTDYILSVFREERGLTHVQATLPEHHEAGNLVHYKSTISAKVTEEFEPLPFASALHPTPAVGGFPRGQALEFIKKNEGYNRSFYAGFLGFADHSDLDLFVNLRCMQLFKTKIILYAGGGITSDSEPEAEWEETEAKLQTLLSVLKS